MERFIKLGIVGMFLMYCALLLWVIIIDTPVG